MIQDGSNPNWAKHLSHQKNRESKKLDIVKQKETKAMLCFASTEKFYAHKEWKLFRIQILKKFGQKCMACGKTSKEKSLHVDHIKPRSKFPDLSFDEDNMQVLCEDCNIGKSNNIKLDFKSTTRAPFTMPELAPYLPDLPDEINAVRSTAIRLKLLIEKLSQEECDTLNIFGFPKVDRKALLHKLFVLVGATHRAANLLANKDAAISFIEKERKVFESL
jgi:5-methylcytosine-specific restriction endonuclease McrA